MTRRLLLHWLDAERKVPPRRLPQGDKLTCPVPTCCRCGPRSGTSSSAWSLGGGWNLSGRYPPDPLLPAEWTVLTARLVGGPPSRPDAAAFTPRIVPRFGRARQEESHKILGRYPMAYPFSGVADTCAETPGASLLVGGRCPLGS